MCGVAGEQETTTQTGREVSDIMSKKCTCDTCHDTGFYGDNGPGTKNNREWCVCDACPESGTKLEGKLMSNARTLKKENERLRATQEKPGLCYLCAVCGAPAYTDCLSLDTGATFTCERCGGQTTVTLSTPDEYCRMHYRPE